MSQPVSAPTGAAATQALLQGVAAGSGTGGTGSGASIPLPNPPPALAALAVGQTIRAVAIGRGADGKVLLETRFGQLALDLPVAPQRGTVVQLQVARAGDPVLLRLVQPAEPRSPGGGEPAAPARGPAAPLRPGETLDLRRLPATAGAPAEAQGIRARLLAVQPPGARMPATGPAASGAASVVARVGASPPGGPSVLQTEAGRFSLPNVGGLETGTRLILAPLGPAGAPAPAGLAAGGGALTALGSAWAALDDAHGALIAAAAGGEIPVAPSAIPSTGPRLTAGIVLFLSALMKGNLHEWLGRDAVRMLEHDRRPLLMRLGEDFAQLSRVAHEAPQGEWRVMMLPLLHDGLLQQIRLYLRDHHGDEGEAGGEDSPGTRFVVEASLSRLGPLQLDGLVRPHRFDLMVRTHTPLPPDLMTGISALFDEANRTFDAHGRIGFRTENPFAVRPDGGADAHATGVMA